MQAQQSARIDGSGALAHSPEDIQRASCLPVIYGEGSICSAHAKVPAIAAEGHALHDANLGKLLCCFACKSHAARWSP